MEEGGRGAGKRQGRSNISSSIVLAAAAAAAAVLVAIEATAATAAAAAQRAASRDQQQQAKHAKPRPALHRPQKASGLAFFTCCFSQSTPLHATQIDARRIGRKHNCASASASASTWCQQHAMRNVAMTQ
jgi:hypothetical protein